MDLYFFVLNANAPLQTSRQDQLAQCKMKISLLLSREPFPVIFEETMERYFAAVTGRAYRVRWRQRTLLERISRSPTSKEWICNPLINSIFTPSALNEVMELPKRWYGSDPSLARNVAQRAYVWTATCPILRSTLAGPAILIDPIPPNASNMLITGGNTRLRLFDFVRGEATTILKSRFDESFVNADLQVRSAHPWLPAPAVLRVLDLGRAYVEPILSAGTAADIPNWQSRQRVLNVALQACDRLGHETAEVVSGKTYLFGLLDRCRKLGDYLGMRQRLITEWVSRWTARAQIIGDLINDEGSFKIEIGRSHGDLSLGNILADDGDVYLVDWERTSIRIKGFDAITLALASRYKTKGLVQRAHRLLAGNRDTDVASVKARLALTGGDAKQTKAKLIIYLAEELLFHLEENSPLPIMPPTLGLSRLMAELEKNE